MSFGRPRFSGEVVDHLLHGLRWVSSLECRGSKDLSSADAILARSSPTPLSALDHCRAAFPVGNRRCHPHGFKDVADHVGSLRTSEGPTMSVPDKADGEASQQLAVPLRSDGPVRLTQAVPPLLYRSFTGLGQTAGPP